MTCRSTTLVASLATSVALLVAGCSDTEFGQNNDAARRSTESTRSGDVPRNDDTINYRKPSEVCEAFARIIYTHDTTTDSHPGDAYLRSRPYVTYEFYARLKDQPVSRTSPEWDAWRQHQVRTQVILAPFAGDVLGPPSAGQRAHSVLVDVAPLGQDGWRAPTQQHAVHCVLSTQDSQWRVATYDIEDFNVA